MAINLNNRSIIELDSLSKNEIEYLLQLSHQLKREKKSGFEERRLKGKSVALIFEKDSTRTRCAFEVACYDQGAHTTYIGPSGSQFGKKESVSDTAKVLGRMYDAIQFRGFSQTSAEILAKNAGVPVYNGLTDDWHPTQTIADLMTIEEKKGTLKGLKVVFCGDVRNNVARSLMAGCAKLGMHYVGFGPKSRWIDEKMMTEYEKLARKEHGSVQQTENPEEAMQHADVVYTDVWVSMGEPETVWDERIKELASHKVTAELMAISDRKPIFMHCLPAFHDTNTKIGKAIAEKFGVTEMEVTDKVFSSPDSVVFDQAENRLHTIKAILVATLTSS